MKKIDLITFKGCQTAIDLGRQIIDLIQAENLDAEVETIVVPSLEKAEEMGLYGSPTILVDGEEYQKQPFSQAGFYWRSYLTADGVRPYPLAKEIIALLRDKPKRFADIHASDAIHYPTLLTGEWWPFSLTASSFWGEIAEEVGVDLIVVSVESDEGARLKALIHATGVPCLIAAPDVTVYGVQQNRPEAKKLLQSLANNGR